MPGHSSSGNIAAGAIHVLYGSPSGLVPSSDQFFSQNTGSIAGANEDNDNCGAALAIGDFNGDSFSDLAFGCPGETLGTAARAGAVIVLYGSAAGLSDSGSQFLSQATGGVPGAAEKDDRCGSALTAGDFNNDGRADLAWGCPGDQLGAFTTGAGSVNVLYGASTGLTASGSQFWTQGSSGVGDSGEGGDQCGAALTAADFNGDGRDDLAMGCPGEDYVFPLLDVGLVHVFYGSSTGLSGSTVTVSQQDRLSEGAEGGDRCGAALAAGKMNGDQRADLAIGCPGEDLIVSLDSGLVNIRHGAPVGFTRG